MIDSNQNMLGVNPLNSPIWQSSVPPVSTSTEQGVGGPFGAIQEIKGSVGGPDNIGGSIPNQP